MSCEGTSFYAGEDIQFRIDLKDTTFAELTDIIVGIRIDNALKKTMKKTASGADQVVVDPDSATKCLARLFRSETATWEEGNVILEVTPVYADPGFPQGKHETHIINAGSFSNSLTKAS